MSDDLRDRVVVITGASSGIGRETALHFAREGAYVVLAARSKGALGEVARDITQAGGRAEVVVTDVSRWPEVERLAQQTVDRCGRIDVWVNNAGVAVYATAAETTVEEIERIIRVNLLGQIYGMKAVLPHMQTAGGGTIINVGSVESERALPYHAAYSASKHGVKGFTEALRLELAHEGSPVQVTLILPASINTPFFTHARSRLGVKPLPMPPIYDPRAVAAAIVAAARAPQRDIYVGGSSRMFSVLERLSPALVDRMLLTGGAGFRLQRTDEPDDGRDNLFAPLSEPARSRGEFGRFAQPTSLYTQLIGLHPRRTRLLAGLGLGLLLLARLRR